MSNASSLNAEPTLDQLCRAAIREKDPAKLSAIIEQIDRKFDEDHKRHSLMRSMREREAFVIPPDWKTC